MVGQSISHYRVVEKLGEGGMGVVYKAEDTTLERAVALKFLADHLLNDDEAKERFLREAKAAAALHHPNICPVHEIAEADGKTFIAMAYLEGESLEERIAQGPFSVKDALDIARQVADGLDAAHEKGVFHRDIKPANIMIDAKGRATIMDFGLARLTEASRLTKVDTAMGTVAYMSPEQGQGMDVDGRTDIWALGCVLYEMVSGQRPFQGQYDQALLYEIVHEEVAPLTSIRAGVPMELEFAVGKCLEKDADSRYQHASDVAVDLRNLQDKLRSGRSTILRTTPMTAGQTVNPAEALPPDAVVMKRSSQRALQAVAAVATFALLALAALHFQEAPPLSLPTVEFSAAAPEGLRPGQMSLSPDGRYLAVSGSIGDPESLWVRSLDSDEWRQLDSTAGATFPFWSPNSEEIGFFADGRLKKISAAGGPPQTIAEANDGRGGSWGKDGTILFAPLPFGQILRVSESGGEPSPVTEPTGNDDVARGFSQLLPDGTHFLYADRLAQEQTGIYLGSLDGGAPRRLLPDSSNHLYMPGADGSERGFLLFVREGVLMAQPFDAARLELAGGAVALPVNPARDNLAQLYGFAASDTGLLAHSSSTQVGPQRLVWVDRTGEVVERTNLVATDIKGHRLSPDGQRVSYSALEGVNQDVWVYDFERETHTRLSDDTENGMAPLWSPDGLELAFRNLDAGGLVMRLSDGSRPAVQLPAEGPNLFGSDWSADGRFLLYSWQDPENSHDLWFLERAGAGNGGWEPRVFLSTPSLEKAARLSPNGRYVAYGSDESGRAEVYVQPFPDGGQRTTVSTGGGGTPVWSRDGSELFYVAPGPALVAVQVRTDGEFSVLSSTKLFESAGLTTGAPGAPFDVSLDAQRFLVTESADGDTQRADSSIRFIQNWPAKYLPRR